MAEKSKILTWHMICITKKDGNKRMSELKKKKTDCGLRGGRWCKHSLALQSSRWEIWYSAGVRTAWEDPSGFSTGTPTAWHQYMNASQSVTVHCEGLNKPRSWKQSCRSRGGGSHLSATQRFTMSDEKSDSSAGIGQVAGNNVVPKGIN